MLHSIYQQIWKTAVATGLEKVSFHSNLKEGHAMPKNVQTTVQLHLFHILVRFCSKSFKLGFSSIWNENFQMYKLGLENVEETEIKLPAFVGSWRKKGHSRKTSTSASLITLSFWLCGSHKLKNSYKNGSTRSPSQSPKKPVCRPRNNG